MNILHAAEFLKFCNELIPRMDAARKNETLPVQIRKQAKAGYFKLQRKRWELINEMKKLEAEASVRVVQ